MYRTEVWTLGEGEGGMFWENSIETCILIYGETDHQPRLDAWDKCSGLVHWEDPEGSGGEGGGRGDRDGEYMWIHGWFIVNVWQKPLQYCKVISLQLIKINGKKMIMPPLTDSNPHFLNSRLLLAALVLNYKKKKTAVDNVLHGITNTKLTFQSMFYVHTT